MKLVSLPNAAKHLGISRHTFEKRLVTGDPLYQPCFTDPVSGRRSFDLMEMDNERRRRGELKAERRAS